MRTGIVTINSANFGNRLQNYALQQTLLDLGCDCVETLRRSKSLSLPQRVKLSLRNAIKKDRYSSIDHFTNQWIKQSAHTLTSDYQSPGFDERYDLFVIGSDQVWNPHFSINSEQDYLPQVPPSKKIAYAASFGVDSVQEDAERIGRLLDTIPHIAVREDAGARIVYQLTGRTVPVVLDPTMLLTSTAWAQLESKPKGFPFEEGEYQVRMFLDSGSSSERLASNAHGADAHVVDLSNKQLPYGPQEFLWLIHHASLVLTDSYHATVFCLLFHTPVIPFSRAEETVNMSSRFMTLERLFQIKCPCVSNTDAGKIEEVDPISWESIEQRLDAERGASLAWLRSAASLS